MKIIVASLLYTFVITGDTKELNLTSTLEEKINGVEPILNEPTSKIHAVSIRETIRNRPLCTGAVFTEEILITTADCIQNLELSQYFRDEILVRSIAHRYNVTNLKTEGKYKYDPLNYNIGVIKISEKINLENHPIITGAKPKQGDFLLIYGYGRKQNDICALPIQVLPQSSCYSQRLLPRVSKWSLCAHPVNSNLKIRKTVFKYDLGSPVFNSDGQLVGIVTDKTVSAIRFMSIVHTKIMQFITRTIESFNQ